MPDSQYPYPPDRFDEEAKSVSFHGAHRAEEPFWRQNLVYLIIIAVAVVVLLVLLFTIGGLGRGGDDRAETPATQQTSEEQEPSDGGGDASDGGGEEEDPEAGEEEEETEPEPDLGRPVQILNAAGINGMAAAWEAQLNDAGWEDVSSDNAGSRQEESVVFYSDEADAATAQALADEVGAGEARQSNEYEAPITFIAVAEPEG